MAYLVGTILALLALCGPAALAATSYSKTVDLPPLRMSYSDLQSILDEGARLMSEANAPVPIRDDDIVIQSGVLKVTIQGHHMEPNGAQLPAQIDSFEYIASTLNPAP